MPSRKQSRRSPPTDWLRRDPAKRGRPWAFREQLLGETPLDRLEERIRGHERRIAELESRLALLFEPERSALNGSKATRTVSLRRTGMEPRDYWLAHCEGFLVDTPEGPLGVVEDVRFRSRLDLPDEIAIRAGRLRPMELLVPIADIEDVDPDDERIVLRSAPRIRRRHELVQTLLLRARRRLDGTVSPSSR